MEFKALREALEAQAAREGFGQIGVTAPNAMIPNGKKLRTWIAEGHHGSMGWFERRLDWRADATRLWPEARSVVMLADNYAPERTPLESLHDRTRPTVAAYARGRDYHDDLKKRVKRLARWLVRASSDHSDAPKGGPATTQGPPNGTQRPVEAQVKVFVDTAPVMEKPLAQAANLGWQGKHTNLVSREFGSWTLLAAIFTTLDLPKDEPHTDGCGTCRACLDVCPTAAFPAPYRLDARRCLAYLTIEHDGPIPIEFRAAMGNRIFGCDDCLAVCPWNKFAKASRDAAYATRDILKDATLADLAALDEAAFRAAFSRSPIKRTGRDRIVRNVLYAIGNSGDPTLASAAEPLTSDPSPVVRDAAGWALGRLMAVAG